MIFFLSLFATACQRGTTPEIIELTATAHYLGTRVEITVLGEDRRRLGEALAAAFSEIGRLESLASQFQESSELWQVNAQAGEKPVAVSAELFFLLEASRELSIWSEGAFDITIGTLKGLWSFDPASPRLPSERELNSRLYLIGWEKVMLEPVEREVSFLFPEMRIDLGGIAKGWAVDQAALVLQSSGVSMALINAGGDLRLLGSHGDRPWQVGLQHPRKAGALIATLHLTNTAVATSGDYEKFFVHEGKRFSHIINPRTGSPANLCQSVTIIASEAWLADGLATAVFVLGPEKGFQLLGRFPGTAGIIIDQKGKRLVSPEWAERVQWEE